jgi:hypothetical protein
VIIKVHLHPEEMVDPIIRNRRIMIKSYKIGNTGDIFSIGARKYKIIEVVKDGLAAVAVDYYIAFGYTSPDEFLKDWATKNNMSDPDGDVFVYYIGTIGHK